MMKNKKQKGFTVIEILVVLFVLGLLMGVAIPRFQKAQDQSFSDSMIAKVNTLNLSLEEFRGECGYYPVEIGGEVTYGSCGLSHMDFLPGNSGDGFDDISYVSLRDSNIQGCTGYHIGVKIKPSYFLERDEDFDSTSLSSPWRLCDGGVGFNGEDTLDEESYYDITTIQ